MMNPQLTVIVPFFNAADTFAETLDALSKQTVTPLEFLLVDNGSTDESRAIATKYLGKLHNSRIVDAFERRGVAHARNVGANLAAGDAIVFCDGDDIPDKNWVLEIIKALSHSDFVASCLEIHKLNGPHAKPSQYEGLMQCNPLFFPRATGCGLAVKISLHNSVGGFDESLRYTEDDDYCWKIQLKGVQLFFAKNAVIHSRLRSTNSAAFRQGYNWGADAPLVYQRYKPYGMKSFSSIEVIKLYGGLLKWSIYCLLHERNNKAWLWLLGWRIGYLKGCVQHHIWGFIDL